MNKNSNKTFGCRTNACKKAEDQWRNQIIKTKQIDLMNKHFALLHFKGRNNNHCKANSFTGLNKFFEYELRY